MRKILLTASIVFAFGQGKLVAQMTEKISFETAEGFQLGDLHGQHGWESYGTANDSVNIVSTLYSDGEQAVELIANGNFTFKGFQKNTTNLHAITKYSWDVWIADAEWSETLFDIVDETTDANYSINLGMGGDVWVGDGGQLTQVNGLSFNSDQWYKLSYLVNHDTGKVELFFDGTSLSILSLTPDFEVNKLDFYAFDLGSSFAIDNIMIEEIADLSTQDLLMPSIQIYPNPANDYLTIETSQTIQGFEIYSLTGQLIKKGTTTKVDVSRLKKGNYIIQVKTTESVLSKKFIKK